MTAIKRLTLGLATTVLLATGMVASAPPSLAAPNTIGGGCHNSFNGEVGACISQSGADVLADTWINTAYSGCWVDLKLYEYDTSPNFILNEAGYDCSNGGHKGPIGINVNIPMYRQYGRFYSVATLNDGSSATSYLLCLFTC